VAGSGWRPVLLWAFTGTAFAVAMTLANLASTYDTLGGLVVTGPGDPAAKVFAEDMPGYPVLNSGRHDGALFYVIAREPMHPESAAEGLDRPRYRLQRTLFPWLAWALHPTGGGEGLVWAMFIVGVIGVFAGSVATGALSVQLRGPPWPAIAFGLMTGTFTSLRISTPDPLALAFAFWALWFLLRNKLGWAVLVAVASVLTKETSLLVLVGFALWRRDRDSALVVAAPVAVAGAWWLWLRILLPDVGNQVVEFVPPFTGWVEAGRFWAQGYEPLGLMSFVAAVVVSIVALVRGGLRHPFGWAILLNLGMFVVLSVSAIAPERSAGRTTMAAFLLAIIVLATYRRIPKDLRTPGRSDDGERDEASRWSRGLRLRRTTGAEPAQ